MIIPTAATRKANGYAPGDGSRRISVSMPEADFNELKMRALKSGRSINRMICEYITAGLDVDRDWQEEIEIAALANGQQAVKED